MLERFNPLFYAWLAFSRKMMKIRSKMNGTPARIGHSPMWHPHVTPTLFRWRRNKQKWAWASSRKLIAEGARIPGYWWAYPPRAQGHFVEIAESGESCLSLKRFEQILDFGWYFSPSPSWCRLGQIRYRLLEIRKWQKAQAGAILCLIQLSSVIFPTFGFGALPFSSE